MKALVRLGPDRKLECSKNVEGNPRAREAQGCISASRRQRRTERAWLGPSPDRPGPAKSARAVTPARRPRAAAPWPATCRRTDLPPAPRPSCQLLTTPETRACTVLRSPTLRTASGPTAPVLRRSGAGNTQAPRRPGPPAHSRPAPLRACGH